MKNPILSFRQGGKGLVSSGFPVIISLALTSGFATADNGVWTSPAAGDWSESTNWSAGTIADGSGFGADFSTLDPASILAVSLDSPRTLSSLVFGDSDIGTAGGWLLDNNADPLNLLTLDGASTITVNALGTGMTAEINAGVASSGGLTKAGPGQLSLTGENSISGSVTVDEGKLLFSAMPASPLYTIDANASLEINRATGQDRNIKDLTITGIGNFIKSGPGNLVFSRFQDDDTPYVWSLGSGAQIRVEGGLLKVSEYNTVSTFSGNQSSLHISSGATFEGLQSNVNIDALTGAGIYQGGWFGPRKLTLGVAGGSGTFSGTIRGNGTGAEGSVPLLKRGNGEQILNGTLNFRGAYGTPTLEVRDGTFASPSRLVISPVGSSVMGVDSESIYTSTGTQDVTELTQTSGTLVAGSFGIAENSQGTYNFSGGLVNTNFLSFAFSGGGNNGPAVMNISDSAQLNVRNNGDIRMGVYWGRSITINQTGGEVVQYSNSGTTRGGTGRLNFAGGNQFMTWNLSGGTLSLAGIAWQAAGGGAGGGNGVLNLNGGILQITSSSFSAPIGNANSKPKVAARVFGDEFTADSGAIIDNYGLNVTFAAPILHGASGVFDGGLKLATSVPGGSLTLTGTNTYTGDTTIVTGNTLVLGSSSATAFVLDGLSANRIKGAGSVTLDGTFTVDTTFADLTDDTSWSMVDVGTLTETFGTGFNLQGFVEAGTSGIHTKTDGANTWTFDESTGILTLNIKPAGGYASWISTFTVADATAGADPDNDGIENLLEYVVDGDPSVSDPENLPDLNATGPNLTFSFQRRDDSELDSTQVFQYGSNLAGWTDVAVGAADSGPDLNGVSVTISEAGAAADEVTVTVPKTLAADGKLFGRLKATQP